MRIPHLISVALVLLAASTSLPAASNSADAPHLHVQLVVPRAGLNRGEAAAPAGLYFKLENGWHIYWKNAGDSGEPPHMRWTLPEGITAGPLQFPAPKRLPLGPLMDFGYENEVLFPFLLQAAPNATAGAATLHAHVDWLVCREMCIPGKADLEVIRNITDPGAKSASVEPDAALYARLGSHLPKPLPADAKAVFQPTANGFRLSVETGVSETQAQFFPADQGVLENSAPQRFTSTPTGLILDLKKDANLTANPSQLKGVLELSRGRTVDLAALPGALAANGAASSRRFAPSASSRPAPVPTSREPLSRALPGVASAPAVAPPASSPLPAKAPLSWPLLTRTIAFAFVGGLILNLMPCVFPVLFIKGLALVNSGNKERSQLRAHGLVYTVGILVSFWVLVALLLGLRAAGSTLGWGFQFQSPVFLALMAALLFFLGLSLAGQFEIGLRLTSAGGSLANKGGYWGSFFTGVLAVLVATPCTAPFMGAAIGYALGQSVTVTFAVFTAIALGLAAPYAVLTLQPAWTRVLPRPGAWMEVLKQGVSVPIFATVIWLSWVLAQAYGANILACLMGSFLMLAIAGWFLGRWPGKDWSTGVASAFVLGVVAVSVFAPRKLVVASETQAAAVKIPGQWESWSPELLARYQAQGRPVFVDFTASWCLSCQVNERVALHQARVVQAFESGNVALLRADWTRHDEAITQALTAMGRSGVPAYALYVPGQSSPQLLPEVLTQGIVTDALGKLPRGLTQTNAAAVANSR